MADTEIVVQAQSTAFQRTGNSFHRKGYTFPSDLASLISAAYYNSSVSSTFASAERQMLYNLFVQDPTLIPGGLTLKNIQSLFPSAFNGAEDLQAIYQKDPWSIEFELETQALYERQYDKARAAAQSGPGNVRGATARQAFELAALDTEMANNRFLQIWQAQVAIAQLVVQAVQVAAQAEAQKWNLQLQAQQQQAATEQGRVVQALGASENAQAMRQNHTRMSGAGVQFLGQEQMSIEEDLAGEGTQGGATTGFGMSYWR